MDENDVDQHSTKMGINNIDLSDVLIQNYTRYSEILGPLDITDEQYEILVHQLWELSCNVSRYFHEGEIPQKILYSILEKACQEAQKGTMNLDRQTKTLESEET